VSSEPLNAPERDDNAPDAPEDDQAPAESSTDATTGANDTGANAEQAERTAALRKRVAELETDLHRERLGHAYNLPDAVAARITGTTAEERETDAKRLADVFHTRTLPVGRGGLDPTGQDNPRVTWPGAFRRARENRRNGGSGVTYFSDSRSSGEL
jgi:hypothetical protein